MTNSVLSQMPIVVLPGWQNSNDSHWQTLWEKEFNWKRVQQSNWQLPDKNDWVTNTRDAIKSTPVIFVAHSLGCTTLAHLVSEHKNLNIKGAILVSPPDLSQEDTPSEIKGFAPTPMVKFPFPSLVVASSSDPFATLERMSSMATQWGSDIVNVGDKHHIGDGANVGSWPEGQKILLDFMKSI